MASFGSFETGREVFAGPVYTVFSATRAGDPKTEYAIKVFSVRAAGIDVESAAELEPLLRDIERSCMDRIKVQEKGAAASRFITPVLESGQDERGVWYATNFYPRSVNKIIAGKVEISTDALEHLIRSVTQAALDLKRTCGRSHGEILPSNVQISKDALESAQVVVSDPLPGDSSEAARYEKADLRAIGELIYQLVLKKSVDFQWVMVPLDATPDWASMFGGNAPHWLGLCNRLLDPQLSLEKMSLEGLLAELQPSKGPKIFLKAAALLVLLGVLGGGGYFGFKLYKDKHFQTVMDSAREAEQQGNFTNALAAYQTAQTLRPNEKGIADKVRELGPRAQQQAQQAEREQEFRREFDEAEAQERAGNFPGAIARYEAAQKIRNDERIGPKLLELQRKTKDQNATAEENRKREEQFQSKLFEAQSAERSGDLTNALSLYQAAQTLKPQDEQVVAKIRDLRPRVESVAQQEQQFQKILQDAERFETQNDFTNALAKYQAAETFKRGDKAITDKIKILSPKADKQKTEAETAAKLEQNFLGLMNEADAAERKGDFTNALTKYQAAKNFKPNDERVEARIRTVTPKANEQKMAAAREAERAKNFEEKMSEARAAESSGNFTNALSAYEAAQTFKPEDATVKAKITDLKPKADAQIKAAAQAVMLDQQFRQKVKDAGAAEQQGNFTNALALYQEAIKMKPDATVDRKIVQLKSKAAAQTEAARKAAALEQEFREKVRTAQGAEAQKNYTNAFALYREARALKADPEVDKKITELKPKAEQQLKEVEDAEYNLAADLFAKCQYQEAAARCNAHPGIARFEALKGKIEAARQALDSASQNYNTGNYGPVVSLDETFATNACFSQIVQAARGEKSTLDQLEPLQKTETWGELKSRLEKLDQKTVGKTPFVALSRWVESHNPVTILEGRFQVLQAQFGILKVKNVPLLPAGTDVGPFQAESEYLKKEFGRYNEMTDARKKAFRALDGKIAGLSF